MGVGSTLLDRRDDSKHNLTSAIYLYYVQFGLIVSYAICSFALPSAVAYMSEATHVASLHAIISVVTSVISLIVARAIDIDDLPAFFPVTPSLAEVPIFVVSLVNALLLIFLGVESWLRAELGSSKFSVLSMVQLLAAVETAALAVSTARCTWRYIQYRKLQGEFIVSGKDAGHLPSYMSPFPQRRFSRGDVLASPMLARSSFMDGEAGYLPMTSPAAGQVVPFNANAQQVAKLQDRVRQMEAKEGHLLQEMQSLAAELEKHTKGSSAGASVVTVQSEPSADGTVSSLPPAGTDSTVALLRAALDDVARVSEENRKLRQNISDLEEKSAYLESELKRAGADVQKLRGALKDERKKNEKLYATLDLEREANAQAQSVISDMRARLPAPGSVTPLQPAAVRSSMGQGNSFSAGTGGTPSSSTSNLPVPLTRGSSTGQGAVSNVLNSLKSPGNNLPRKASRVGPGGATLGREASGNFPGSNSAPAVGGIAMSTSINSAASSMPTAGPGINVPPSVAESP